MFPIGEEDLSDVTATCLGLSLTGYLYITCRIPLAIGGHKTPYRKMGGAEWLVTVCNRVTPSDWHVVDDPLVPVALMDLFYHKVQLLFVFGV